MNGHPFDARHTFQINRFTDIERYAELDETYVEPEREEYHTKVCTIRIRCRMRTNAMCRSTSEHGSRIPQDATSSSHTGPTKSPSTGTESHRNVKSRFLTQ